MSRTVFRESESSLAGEDYALAGIDTPRALSLTQVPLGRATLVPGVTVAASLSLDRARVRFDVMIFRLVVWSATLEEGKTCTRWSGNQGLFKEDVELGADLARGELTLNGTVCVRELDGWTCHQFDDEVVLAWSPMVGAVGGQIHAHPPVLDPATLPPSRSIVPTITRIPVDTVPRLGTPVGRLVKETFFEHLPDFVFNVCFSVGDFPLAGPGNYGDPRSPWFNVFVGYYQIDCPKPAWSRPFGYEPGAEGAMSPRFDDVLRIGKADWNYFSNWMYGVPIEAVRPFDAMDPDVRCALLGRRTVGSSAWDLVDLDGFSAVTAYQSSAPGAASLVENTVLTDLWRVTYGEPNSQPGRDTSFVGSRMHARLFMAFTEDEEAHHTYLFGGTVNKAFDGPMNDAFLAEQLTACQAVIEAHYPTLGFPL